MQQNLRNILYSKQLPLIVAILVPILYILNLVFFENYDPSILLFFLSFMVVVDNILAASFESATLHGVILLLSWSIFAFVITFLIQKICLRNISLFKKISLFIILWLITLAPWYITTLSTSMGGCYEDPPNSVHVITGKIIEPIGCGAHEGFGFRLE